MPQFFLSYVTANDDPGYAVDFANFDNMVRHDPGAPRIEMYIAVSEATPRSRRDERIVSRFGRRLGASPIISVANAALKSNVGRDFSSAAYNLRLIARVAEDEDFILFLNRSAYGPLTGDWYRRYVAQYLKHPNTQLCGSTINFCGHPDLPSRHQATHVQTYAFMGKARDFREFLGDFPGERETERLGVIDAGELGLSDRILKRGGALTSLAWPEYSFSRNQPTPSELPHRDIKEEVEGLPFQYRARGYKIAWWRKVPGLLQRLVQVLRRHIIK